MPIFNLFNEDDIKETGLDTRPDINAETINQQESLKPVQNELDQMQQNQPDFDYNTSSADLTQTVGNDLANQQKQQTDAFASMEMNQPTMSQFDVDLSTYVDPGKIDATIAADFGRSLNRGVGSVIGGLGDLTQALSGLIGSTFGNENAWQENTLSEYLHGISDSIKTSNQNYIPKEFENIGLKQLGTIEGWRYLLSNNIAEAIPYAVEFILTGYGAGSLAKAGASKLAKRKLSKMLKDETIDNLVKKGAVKGVSKQGRSKGVEYTAKFADDTFGNKVTRALLNEKGLSKKAGEVVSTMGAGAGNNLLISLSQSAEAVNQAKMYKDDKGNPLFSEEELAEIGRDTFWNETAYMGIEMLSWGVTFGNIGKGMFRGAGLKSNSKLNKTFGRKAQKVFSKLGIEGTEETIQETYEEWAKELQIQQALYEKGEIDKDPKTGLKGFFDYYTEKGADEIKITSFIMGGLMGGGKAAIDNMAEKAVLLNNAEELLKTKLTDLEEGKLETGQEEARISMIANIVADGRHELLESYMEQWVENGTISEEQYDEYVDTANQLVNEWNKAQDLNTAGAERIYQILAENKIEELAFKKKESEFENRISKLKETFGEEDGLNEFIDQEKKVLNEEKDKLLDKLRENKIKLSNLLLGKKFTKYVDEKGEDITVDGEILGEGLSEDDYNRYTKTGEQNATKEKVDNAKGGIMDFFSKINPFKSKAEKESKTEETEETEIKKDDTTSESETDNNQKYTYDKPFAKVVNLGDDTTNDFYFEHNGKYAKQRSNSVVSLELPIKYISKEEYEKAVGKPINTNTEEDTTIDLDDEGVDYSKISDDDKGFIYAAEMSKRKDKADLFTANQIGKQIFGDDFENKEEVINTAMENASSLDSEELIKIADGIKRENGKKAPDTSKKSKGKNTGEWGKRSFQGRMRKKKAKKQKTKKESEEEFNKEYEALDKTDAKAIQDFIGKFGKDRNVNSRKELQDLTLELGKLKAKNFLASLKQKYQQAKDVNSKAKIARQINEFKRGKNIARSVSNSRKIALTNMGVAEKVIDGNAWTINQAAYAHGLASNPTNYAKFVVQRRNIQKRFPDVDIVMVDNVSRFIGQDAFGYMIGSTIFIDENSTLQKDWLNHELAHYFYKLTDNTTGTKRFVNNLLKNDKLVNKVKRNYWDEIQYELTTDKGFNAGTITARELELSANKNFKSEMEFLEYVASGGFNLTELPLEQQDVIKDEVFAHYMETKLNNEFDEYFNRKPVQLRNKFYEKLFWKNVKSKLSLGLVKSQEKEETLKYLADLDIDGIPTNPEFLETYIAKQFDKGFNAEERKSFRTFSGRARRIDDEVKEQLTKEMQEFDPTIINKREREKIAISPMDELLENQEAEEFDANENIESGHLNDKGDAYNASITETIDEYIDAVNDRELLNDTSGNPNVITAKQVSAPLKAIAQQYPGNNEDFIAELMRSDNPVVEDFVEYIKYTKEAPMSFLASTHTHYANLFVPQAITLETDSQGKIQIGQGTTKNELNTIQRNYNRWRSEKRPEFWSQLMKLKKRIKYASKETIANRYQPIIDAMFEKDNHGIVPNTVVFVNGTEMTIKDLIDQFVEKHVTFKSATDQTLVFRKGGHAQFKNIIKYGVLSQRKARGEVTAVNGEGNTVVLEQKSNSINQALQQMKRDARDPNMSKTAFNKKYRNNKIAQRIYNGEDIEISQFLGTNFKRKGSVYKNTSGTDMLVNGFMMFAKSGDNYFQEFPVNGESSRRYFMPFEKIDYNADEKRLDEEFESLFEVVRNQGGKQFKANKVQTRGRAQKFFKIHTDRMVDFLNENPKILEEINKSFEIELIGKNGKLSAEGRKMVGNYVKNYTINISHIRDAFYSGLTEEQLPKRSKSSGSPVININSTGSLRLGIVHVKDFKFNPEELVDNNLSSKDVEEINTTDSMNFVLPKTAKQIQAIYGEANPVGNIFKLHSFSKETENGGFKNKSVTIKGMTFVLTDDFVEKYPGYKPLRDVLLAQDKFITDKFGESSFNLNDGSPHWMPIVAASSSTKTGFENSKGSISVEDLQNKSVEENLATINLDNDYEGGYGFNGQNIGVQNLMDKEYEQSVLASQLIANLFINAGVTGKMQHLNRIQGRIEKMALSRMMAKVKRYLPKDKNSVTDEELKTLKKFIQDNMNGKHLTATTKELLKNFDITLPYLNKSIALVMKNQIVKNNNSIRTNGSVAFQMSDFGMYEFSGSVETDDAVKESKLKSYGFGEEGIKYEDRDGNTVYATKPAEAIVPYAWAKKSGMRLRSKYMSQGQAMAEAFKLAEQKADEMNLKGNARREFVRKFQAMHYAHDENGYYVRGDFFIATRVPSHGKQTTLVLEAKDTAGEKMGSTIIVPSELSSIIGSDYDGDALYMNTYNNEKPNKAEHAVISDIIDYMTDVAFQDELKTALNMTELKKEVEDEIKAKFNIDLEITDEAIQKSAPKDPLESSLTPMGQREAHKDNIETRGLVGLSASLHRFINILSAFDTPFEFVLNINGNEKKEFNDTDKRRYWKTAILLNVILDNAKNKIAEKIGINPATATQFTLLASMGYDFGDIATIMKSEGAEAWSRASEDRGSSYVDEFDKGDVISGALERIGVTENIQIGTLFSIDTDNLVSKDANIRKAENLKVIRMMSALDDMQSELYKVNKIISTHKGMEGNPFTLENDMIEFDKLMENGIIQYTDDFKKSPLVRRYLAGNKLAIEANEKTNPTYNATGIKLVKNFKEKINKDLSKQEYNKLEQKVAKANLAQSFKIFRVSKAEIKERLYAEGGLFDKLSQEFRDDIRRDIKNPLLSQGYLKFSNENNYKRIWLSSDLIFHGNEALINKQREGFEMLSPELKRDLILYDFVENGFSSFNSIFPIFDTNTINTLNYTFKKQMIKNSRSINESSLQKIQDEIARSMHNSIGRINIDENGKVYKPKIYSEFGRQILENKPFYKKVVWKGQVYVREYIPMSEEQIKKVEDYFLKKFPSYDSSSMLPKIKKNKDYQIAFIDASFRSTDGMVDLKSNFRPVGKPFKFDYDTNTDNELYNDINIITSTQGVELGPIDPLDNQKKKTNSNLGRKRVIGSEEKTEFLSEEQWRERNDIFGDSRVIKKAYNEYQKQFAEAKAYYNKVIRKNEHVLMSTKEIKAKMDWLRGMQPEAAAIALNPLAVELGRRNSAKQTKVTNTKEGKDFSIGEKYLISSNIPARFPGLQRFVKKLNEQYKKFLRKRSDHYDEISKVTNALYKEKFGGGDVQNWFRQKNPFKGQQMYNVLYGNLVNKKKINNVLDISLKPKEEIEANYRKGIISKAEKDFYDVFTKTTAEYEGLLGGKAKRANYIPHSRASALEALTNRGVLGMFMNSQTELGKLYDIKLTGYDPIKRKTVTQSFKQFEDSYNAASMTSGEGNRNILRTANFIKLKLKAQRLARKGTNEDGSQIIPSQVTIETLAEFTSRNRFTKQRSVKSTKFPTMDLNKALMDFTHASTFSTFMEPLMNDLHGLRLFYKQRGNKEALDLIDKVYRDKYIRGVRPTSFIGKNGDKLMRGINAITVFMILGFKTAFIGGNIAVGKYHNVKNSGGKKWVTGEKRFWGFDGIKENGLQGWFKNFQDSIRFLRKIGFMEQNVYEEINLEQQWNPIQKLENIALLGMTLSEKWIQGVEFLGQLTDEEWKDWKENGKMISETKQIQYEEIVKRSQGRGYNFTDQRLVSLYSLGQTLMMFNRFIPTMFNERFGPKEVDAYGNKYKGSLRQFGETAVEVLSGRMRLQDFKSYRNKLEPEDREALDKALRGMSLLIVIGMIGMAGGASGMDDIEDLAEGVIADANASIDLKRYKSKIKNNPVLNNLNRI